MIPSLPQIIADWIGNSPVLSEHFFVLDDRLMMRCEGWNSLVGVIGGASVSRWHMGVYTKLKAADPDFFDQLHDYIASNHNRMIGYGLTRNNDGRRPCETDIDLVRND